MKNDYELVRWPPDVEKDKAAGIHVAGMEQEDDTPDAAQVHDTTVVLGGVELSKMFVCFANSRRK